MLFLYLFLYVLNNAKCEYFDSYYGVPIGKEQVRKYEKEGNVQYCAVDVKLPCDPNEWSRLDGTCNNLKHPSYGAIPTRFLRLLEPVFGKDLRDRPSEKGGELPLVRRLRTKILKEGKASDPLFTNLMTYHTVYIFTDIASINDTLNYTIATEACCDPKYRGDYRCTPQKIPDDDPVHRFSHIRCMNQTRPITYQTFGCLQNGTTIPARINTETALIDQSTLYYYGGEPAGRTFEGGELAVDIVNGKIWPTRIRSRDSPLCVLNKLPEEELCFKYTTNGILGPKFIVVLLIRLHNYIARQLAIINPCWDDERLFYTARDINIAIQAQITYYELFKDLMGLKNLIKEGILSKSKGFRDIYDKNVLPQVSEEFIFALRYFHTVQEADIKLYDNEGYHFKTFPIVNLSLNSGFLLPEDRYSGLQQSSFRQPCGKFDHTVDPLISELGLGPLNLASDITMNDLAKSRTIGFQGYIKYLEYCSGKKYKTFEDLLDVMDQEQMENLKDSYVDVGDIDLMAGMWSERLVPGGYVPHTVYCLLADQLKRFIKSERHWYERKDRPHAFTEQQLLEIRKMTIAYILCTVGDSVDKIQKRAYLRIGPKNPLVSCEEIPKIDFEKWKDYNCGCSNNL